MTLSVAFDVSAKVLKAFYEVPTSQAELVNSNKFQIKQLEMIAEADGQTTLKYTVPVELTGLPNEIDFKGPLTSEGGQLSSEYGILNCVSNEKQMMCSVSYLELKFDNALAQKFMAEKFTSIELEKRSSLQAKFSTDPIGILHIMLKKKQLK